MLRPFKKVLSRNLRAGVMQDGSRIELAVVRRIGNGRMTLAAGNVERDDDDDWAEHALSNVVGSDFRKARVSTVLGAEAYSLQLVEAPNVPDDELHEAVRWRIQHLIEYPIGEAVIETLMMPAHANPGNKPMIYAVVAHRDEILRQIERMKKAGLQMDVIDIPELCMRNVATVLPQDADGVAFMHFTNHCGYLTITRQGVLYMIRRIETHRRALVEANDDDFVLQEQAAGVALEVQRSLDYYESNYDRRPITELVLGPGDHLDALASSLGENLGINVSRLNLGELFDTEDEITANVQSDCLLAVGAALRSDDAVRRAAA